MNAVRIDQMDADTVAATWVRGGVFYRQPLTLREAARWQRGEVVEPQHPLESQALAELDDEIAGLRARQDQVEARMRDLGGDAL